MNSSTPSDGLKETAHVIGTPVLVDEVIAPPKRAALCGEGDWTLPPRVRTRREARRNKQNATECSDTSVGSPKQGEIKVKIDEAESGPSIPHEQISAGSAEIKPKEQLSATEQQISNALSGDGSHAVNLLNATETPHAQVPTAEDSRKSDKTEETLKRKVTFDDILNGASATSAEDSSTPEVPNCHDDEVKPPPRKLARCNVQ